MISIKLELFCELCFCEVRICKFSVIKFVCLLIINKGFILFLLGLHIRTLLLIDPYVRTCIYLGSYVCSSYIAIRPG